MGRVEEEDDQREEGEEGYPVQMVKQEITEEEEPRREGLGEESHAPPTSSPSGPQYPPYSAMEEDSARSHSPAVPPSPVSQPQPPPPPVSHVPTSLGLPPPLQLLHEAHMRPGPPLEG